MRKEELGEKETWTCGGERSEAVYKSQSVMGCTKRDNTLTEIQ